MKSNKINVSLKVDKDLWALAKEILPCSRSSFFETCLENYIGSNDEIADLEKDIEDIESNLKIQKLKLEHIKTKKESNSKDETILSNAMDTIKRINFSHGFVTNKQIEAISNTNNINKFVLIKQIKKINIPISDKDQFQKLKER